MEMYFPVRAWPIAFFLLVFPSLASAEAPSSVEQSYAEAREAMLSDLSNPEKSMAFVQAAVAVDDVRGAISALERILLVNPGLTNIRLELGLLHLRVGAPQIARSYLQTVIEDPDTPSEMLKRARSALEESEQRLAKHRLTGSALLATRYETNANAGPDSVLIGGTPAVIDADDRPEDDVSFAAGLDLRHSYDFGGQRADSLETELTLFGLKYVDVDSSDIGFVSLQTGPTFNLGAGDTPLSLHPYAGGSFLALARESYRNTALIGTEATLNPAPGTFMFAGVEGRLNDFNNSDENPLASQRSGEEVFATLRLSQELQNDLIATAQVFGGTFRADEDFESNNYIGAGIGLEYLLDNPFAGGLEDVRFQASFSYAYYKYDEPNPIIDANETQRDDRIDIGGRILIPVASGLSLDLSASYVDNMSTLPNDDFDNLRVSVGLRYDFSMTP